MYTYPIVALRMHAWGRACASMQRVLDCATLGVASGKTFEDIVPETEWELLVITYGEYPPIW